FTRSSDRIFDGIRRRYERRLARTLNHRPVTLLIVAGVMAAVGVMYLTSQKELAPEEDQGILFNIVKVPQTANLDYLEQTTTELNKVFDTVPEKEHVFLINGMGGDVRMAIAGILFKPWEERKRTQKQILESLQPKLGGIAGGLAISFPLPSLPGAAGGGPPVQFVVHTTADYQQLSQGLAELQAEGTKKGLSRSP